MTLQKRYLLGFLGVLAFAACDPMDDVYKELHIDDEGIKKDMKLTLSDDDYAILKKVEGAPSYTYNSKYFQDDEEAAQYIPSILKNGYSQLRDGSSAVITFNRLVFDNSDAGKIASPLQPDAEYTLNADDYKLVPGNTFPNFNSESKLDQFMDLKFPDVPEFTVKVVNYDLYTGGTTTERTKAYYKLGDIWTPYSYLITKADYESTGDTYYDYDAADDDKLPAYFSHFLSNQLKIIPSNGTIVHVIYLYYGDYPGDEETKNKTFYKIMLMTYDGSKWNEVTETITEPVELNFSRSAGVWKGNLTKNYTVTVDDYAWIAANATVGSDAAKSNLGQYKNFAVSTWGQANIDAALGQLLSHLFPNNDVGTQYNVIYDQYSGGVSTTNILLEKQESGEWTKVIITEN